MLSDEGSPALPRKGLADGRRDGMTSVSPAPASGLVPVPSDRDVLTLLQRWYRLDRDCMPVGAPEGYHEHKQAHVHKF